VNNLQVNTKCKSAGARGGEGLTMSVVGAGAAGGAVGDGAAGRNGGGRIRGADGRQQADAEGAGEGGALMTRRPAGATR
jgi:hypothetical protein